MSEPKQTNLSDIFRALKTETSNKLKGGRPRFWQYCYYDFNVFTQAKFSEKLQYMHRNPVERELVAKPEDRPGSSFNHWATGEQSLAKSNPTGPGPNANEQTDHHRFECPTSRL